MRIHWFQHVPFEGLGAIAGWARRRDHQLRCTRLYAGDPVPAPAAADWLLVMGGPMGVGDESQYPWLKAEKDAIRAAIAADCTVLGICLGAQLIAEVLGSQVTRNAHREIGWFPLFRVSAAGVPTGVLPDNVTAFHWHGDTFGLPPGATHICRSVGCEQQAFLYGERVLGLQFHLETTPDSAGKLIENCGDEMTDGPYIQTAEEILADPQRFRAINVVMDELLDFLAARTRVAR